MSMSNAAPDRKRRASAKKVAPQKPQDTGVDYRKQAEAKKAEQAAAEKPTPASEETPPPTARKQPEGKPADDQKAVAAQVQAKATAENAATETRKTKKAADGGPAWVQEAARKKGSGPEMVEEPKKKRGAASPEWEENKQKARKGSDPELVEEPAPEKKAGPDWEENKKDKKKSSDPELVEEPAAQKKTAPDWEENRPQKKQGGDAAMVEEAARDKKAAPDWEEKKREAQKGAAAQSVENAPKAAPKEPGWDEAARKAQGGSPALVEEPAAKPQGGAEQVPLPTAQQGAAPDIVNEAARTKAAPEMAEDPRRKASGGAEMVADPAAKQQLAASQVPIPAGQGGAPAEMREDPQKKQKNKAELVQDPAAKPGAAASEVAIPAAAKGAPAKMVENAAQAKPGAELVREPSRKKRPDAEWQEDRSRATKSTPSAGTEDAGDQSTSDAMAARNNGVASRNGLAPAGSAPSDIIRMVADSLQHLVTAQGRKMTVAQTASNQIQMTNNSRQLTLDFGFLEPTCDYLTITPLREPMPEEPVKRSLLQRIRDAFTEARPTPETPFHLVIEGADTAIIPTFTMEPIDAWSPEHPPVVSALFVDQTGPREWLIELYGDDPAAPDARLTRRGANQAMRVMLAGIEEVLQERGGG